MDIRTIRMIAPPTPSCFVDRLSWSEYLLSSMESKSCSTRPFINGEFNVAFSHCRDCTTEHRRQMVMEKRCHPPMAAKERAEDATLVVREAA